MTKHEQTGTKRSAGLFLACAMALSLTVVGCGSLAAATGIGGPVPQQVVRDPENPQWIGATQTTTAPGQMTQLRDPENPYWSGSSIAAFDDGTDTSRHSGPR